MKKTKLLLSFVLVLLATAAQAQVPGLINYQGRVTVGTTNFNSPPNGLFKFALVNTNGTTAYWSNDGSLTLTPGALTPSAQPTNAVSLTVSKGLYSVLLGDNSAPLNMNPIPASVWTNPDVRLRVWFNDGVNNSQLLSPDQRLAPNSYLSDGAVSSNALAANAVTTGKIANGAVGSTQIANGAVTSAQLALQSVGYFQLAPGTVDVSHLDPAVANSLWSVLGSDVYRGSGNVGIGATPTKKLDITLSAGPVTTGTTSVDSSLPFIVRNNAISGTLSTPDVTGIGFGRNTTRQAIVGGSFGDDLLDFFIAGNLITPRMRIDHSGNVGIGTSTPKHKLDVNGNVFLGTAVNGATFTELGDTLYLGSPRKYLSNLLGAQVAGTNDWVNLMAHPLSNGIMFGTSGPSDTDPHSAPNPLMVIQSGGNVGIGTATPSEKLTLAGVTDYNSGLRLTGNSGFGTGMVLEYTGPGGHRYSLLSSSSTANPGAGAFGVFDNSGGYRLVILPSGNVGIGTTTPTTTLEVGGEVTCVAMNLTSDRNAKEQFKPISARGVLDKVARLPISEWQYKARENQPPDDARHIGPMAQDFREAFELGHDDKHITSVDADGVALAAIQGLNEKLDAELNEKDARIQRLEENVAELKELVSKMAGQPKGPAK